LSNTPDAMSRYPGLPLAIALVSGAAIGYEILLMRLFSIIQWHHFAYMIISLALLGYGASGVVLALYRDWLNARFQWVFPGGILLFSLAAPGCFWLGQRLPFNPSELFWSPAQPLYLLTLYLLLALPFFFAASAVGLALFRFRDEVSSIYAADLAGAGLGSLVIIGLLFLVPPDQALIALALVGLAGILPVSIAWKKTGGGRPSARPCWRSCGSRLRTGKPCTFLRTRRCSNCCAFREPASSTAFRIRSPIPMWSKA